MRVIDASALIPILLNDGHLGSRAREAIADQPLTAPEVIDLEVTSTLRRLVSRGVMSTARASQAVTDLIDTDLRRVPHAPLLTRCWELRGNVTPYDASYVALAEALDVTLVTADARLAGAPGPTCDFELLT